MSDTQPDPDDATEVEPDTGEWDLTERDALLADGTLTDESAPDPTEVVLGEDD